MTASASDSLLRMREVTARTGMSRSEIYKLMAKGRFPQATRFERMTRWSAIEVERWVADRLAERRAS